MTVCFSICLCVCLSVSICVSVFYILAAFLCDANCVRSFSPKCCGQHILTFDFLLLWGLVVRCEVVLHRWCQHNSIYTEKKKGICKKQAVLDGYGHIFPAALRPLALGPSARWSIGLSGPRYCYFLCYINRVCLHEAPKISWNSKVRIIWFMVTNMFQLFEFAKHSYQKYVLYVMLTQTCSILWCLNQRRISKLYTLII